MLTKAVLLGIALATTIPAVSHADFFGQDCVAAHPDLSDEAKKCYASECTNFIREMDACGSDPICHAITRVNYALALGICASKARVVETSDNLVFWLDTDGIWKVSWPGDEIPLTVKRYEFNL